MIDVEYISGCGNEKDGFECIIEKLQQFKNKTTATESYCVEEGKPCNASTAPTNPPAELPVSPANGDSTSNSNAPAVAAETTTNNSNNQNGALKLVGILGNGWMIFVAAWIY
uniref:Uncharacterized protein n=1 Tax=Panagrolaimus sp. PS1159 TaxID=55785 RepID=A0AC35FNM3_9BILA